MERWTLAAVLLLLSGLGGGCASIVDGQGQIVSVLTPGCAGATCELNNDKGKWYVPATPATITVNRSYADLFVKCSKGEFPPVIQSVPSKTKGMAFGNILFGGVIGAGVDIANGAAYDYPNEISLPYACSGEPPLASAPVRLGLRVKELADVEGGVAGLVETRGVFVTGVDSEGLAARGDIRVGDVLVEFNGRPIADSRALKELLYGPDAAQAFRLRIFRQGQYHVVDIKREERL